MNLALRSHRKLFKRGERKALKIGNYKNQEPYLVEREATKLSCATPYDKE